MPRDTLIDFFSDLSHARGEFLVYDDGFRSRGYSYHEVVRAAHAFAADLHGLGARKGDKIVFWSENRPEWIVAFWGCLLRGIVVVPIDYRASPDFLARVVGLVAAKLVLVGQDVPPFTTAIEAPVWKLHERQWPAESDPPPAALPPVAIGRDDIAEIIFTSGATADPQGVVITHRNVLANIVRWAPGPQYENGGRVLSAWVPEPSPPEPHVQPGAGDPIPPMLRGRGVHARVTALEMSNIRRDPAVSVPKISMCQGSCGAAFGLPALPSPRSEGEKAPRE